MAYMYCYVAKNSSYGVFKSIYLANVQDLLGSNVTYAWLGGSNVNNGTWIWTDGQPFSYTNWAKGIIKIFKQIIF